MSGFRHRLAMLTGVIVATGLAALPVASKAQVATPIIPQPTPNGNTGVWSDTVVLVGHAATNPPVQAVGGKGFYNTNGQTACVLQSDPQGVELPDTSCTFSSPTGQYANTVCGTGFATDSAGQINSAEEFIDIR